MEFEIQVKNYNLTTTAELKNTAATSYRASTAIFRTKLKQAGCFPSGV